MTDSDGFAPTMESLESEEGSCGFYEGYSTQRFIIISGCTTVALFGVLANLLLMAVFRRSLPSSIFLATLATCDTLLCLTYVLLFGVDAGIVYMKNTTLFFLYHRYIVPVFFLTKVVQFAIPFILILITLERYLWTCAEPKRKMLAAIFTEHGRIATVVFVVVFSVALRFPVLYAIKVEPYPLCDDYFRSESVAPTNFANTKAYNIFDFHVITAVQMMFPFVVLLLLNLTIIKRLLAEKREHMYPVLRGPGTTTEVKKVSCVQGNLPENYVLLQVAADVIKESLIHRSSRSKRSQLRNAIYTMLAIVTSYLVCNSIHLFLTILERFEPSYLYESEDHSQSSTFYIVLSDTVSICYMISSAIRIFIYAKCNPKLRQEISEYIKPRMGDSPTSSA